MTNPSESTPIRVIDMSAEEAQRFFLKQESYCGFDLPPYFRFSDILSEVSKCLNGRRLSDFAGDQKPKDCEGVNYQILVNKDGRHAWRPFELIHPALYVSLVNAITLQDNWNVITKRFRDFQKVNNISCISIPLEASDGAKDKEVQILNWWSDIEQKSIELALEYETIVHADITDCYGQIYTHSISWAMHTKEESKKKENRHNMKLIGNVIDRHIQDMRHGQTNGIPQGPVLMDFVAEIVLGYVDEILSQKVESLDIKDYRILRYRDDYRIFVHGAHDGEKILKALTETLIELGLKLNSSKTVVGQNVVVSSIKKDKIDWIARKQFDKDLQKHLLIIHSHSTDHPNAGSLLRALSEFRKRLDSIKQCYSATTLISIIVDIAYNNPRTYPVCAAILSRLLKFVENKDRKKALLEKIVAKFSRLPNTEYMAIWLQRIALSIGLDMSFTGALCDVCQKGEAEIWNSDWIKSGKLKQIMKKSVFDESIADELNEVIPAEEVELFLTHYDG